MFTMGLRSEVVKYGIIKIQMFNWISSGRSSVVPCSLTIQIRKKVFFVDSFPTNRSKVVVSSVI